MHVKALGSLVAKRVVQRVLQMRSSRGGGASQPAKMSSCFALEMALSPTKAGIQQWLGTAEAEAASDVWVSKKRIRFD